MKRVHFIGIGGAGMSGIAEVMLTQGYQVSGSDASANAVTEHLQKLGAEVFVGHNEKHIQGAELVVYSSAISQDNPEWQAAKAKHIPMVARGEMLAKLMSSYYGIAIAGTHGKTTTTGLVTTLLVEGGLDPTFVIGGLLRSAGSNARLGDSRYFVAEADESDASFLYMHPKIAIVTNIDSDHLSTYGDFATLKQTFLEFIHHLPADGLAVLCSDDPVIQELLPKIQRPYVTYGFSEQDDVYAKAYQQNGVCCEIEVAMKDQDDFTVTLNLPGRHNVLNALAAIAVAKYCGVSNQAIIQGLNKFQGTGRRFQLYGDVAFAGGNVLLVDDYGHHPTEIAATLAAVRAAWPERRLVMVFQPHRYTRTQEVFSDFVRILSQPNVLVLLDIYSAGEKPIVGVTGEKLYQAIVQAANNQTVFVEKPVEISQALRQVLRDQDILLLQGAGDIGKVAPRLAGGELKE